MPNRRKPAASEWGWRSSITLLFLAVDLCALTWYLWQLPGGSFNDLKKVLTTAGGWISSIAGFFGIKHVFRKSYPLERVLAGITAELLVGALTAMVWFFVLPFHSVTIRVSGADTQQPLDGARVIVGKSEGQKPVDHVSPGVLRVHGLLAADTNITVQHEGYQPTTPPLAFGRLDILWMGRPYEVVLQHQTGSIWLESEPKEAKVYLDGDPKPVGETPKQITLATGKHRVRYEMTGYRPTEWEEISIGETGNEPFQRGLHLLPKPPPRLYNLSIVVAPTGSRVRIESYDFTSSFAESVKLPAGSHMIKVSKDGCQAVQERVDVSTDNKSSFYKTLTCN